MPTTATLEAQEHLIALVDGPEFHLETADWSTGLIAPLSAGALIHVGVYRGRVTITTEPRTHEPALAGLDLWDEVIDVSVNAPHGDLRLHQLSYGPLDAHPDLPALSPHGPGHYRLRVHARGRDQHHDDILDDSGEQYLIQSWPAQPAPALIIRATDRCGHSMRVSALIQPRISHHDDSPQEHEDRQQREAASAALTNLADRLRSSGDDSR